jgi:hypothetical protein
VLSFEWFCGFPFLMKHYSRSLIFLFFPQNDKDDLQKKEASYGPVHNYFFLVTLHVLFYYYFFLVTWTPIDVALNWGECQRLKSTIGTILSHLHNYNLTFSTPYLTSNSSKPHLWCTDAYISFVTPKSPHFHFYDLKIPTDKTSRSKGRLRCAIHLFFFSIFFFFQ